MSSPLFLCPRCRECSSGVHVCPGLPKPTILHPGPVESEFLRRQKTAAPFPAPYVSAWRVGQGDPMPLAEMARVLARFQKPVMDDMPDEHDRIHVELEGARAARTSRGDSPTCWKIAPRRDPAPKADVPRLFGVGPNGDFWDLSREVTVLGNGLGYTSGSLGFTKATRAEAEAALLEAACEDEALRKALSRMGVAFSRGYVSAAPGHCGFKCAGWTDENGKPCRWDRGS